MKNEEINLIVREIVHDVAKENVSNISLDLSKNQFSDYNINSILFVMLVVRLESEFDIEFDDDYLSLDKFHTFDDFVHYISSKLEVS